MNLKQRFSFLFSLLFSLLLGIALFIIFTLFSNFRKEEFKERLVEKAYTTLKLLVEVKEVDYPLLKIIDKHTINKLYSEKVLIYNHHFRPLYSSFNHDFIRWTVKDLDKLKHAGSFYKNIDKNDIIGLKSHFEGKDYFVLISAVDKFGISKLNYLKYVLIGTFIIGAALIWLLSFYVTKKNLKSLDDVREKIQEITAKNLSSRITVKNNKDEVSALASSFNHMLERIDKSFKYQKEFAGNASHELRTPIARITTQLENMMKKPNLPAESQSVVKSVIEDAHQLSDIVSSLLILSKIESNETLQSFKKVRIDEMIFSCSEYYNKLYPDFKILFEIENESDKETHMEIFGDESLLKIAFNNLLKNAYQYSDNQLVNILIKQKNDKIEVVLTNTGVTPDTENPKDLFNAFARGSNSYKNQGHGLGLRIVQRIVQYHKAEATFSIPEKDKNQVTLLFS